MTLCNDLALWSNISPCRLSEFLDVFVWHVLQNIIRVNKWFLVFLGPFNWQYIEKRISLTGMKCTFLAFTLPWYGKKTIENCYCEIYSLYGFSCLQCFTLHVHVCKAYNVKIQNIYYGRLITPLLLVFFSENKSLPTEIEN